MALYAYNVGTQSVAAGAPIVFADVGIPGDCGVSAIPGSSAATIRKPGLYLVSVQVDAVAGAAGALTFSLRRNGAAVPAAQASVTAADATGTHSFAFTAPLIVLPNCCSVRGNLPAALTVEASAAASVTNAAISVVKVG